MMGAGKTCVGKALSALTGKEFVDTDEQIAKAHGVVTEIFRNHGEAYFRDLETQTAEEFSKRENLIIATGGGFVLREKNVSFLKEKGVIVFLQASEQTLIHRLLTDTDRPLLKDGDVSQKIRSLLLDRTPVYEKIADYTVVVDDKTVEETAKEIINIIDKVKE